MYIVTFNFSATACRKLLKKINDPKIQFGGDYT